jgi:hypothetical protein
MEHQELLTPKQVAEWLQVSTTFVKEHAAELGGVRIGGSVNKAGHWRFRENSVQSWINGGGSSPSQRRPNETPSRPEPKRMVS